MGGVGRGGDRARGLAISMSLTWAYPQSSLLCCPSFRIRRIKQSPSQCAACAPPTRLATFCVLLLTYYVDLWDVHHGAKSDVMPWCSILSFVFEGFVVWLECTHPTICLASVNFSNASWAEGDCARCPSSGPMVFLSPPHEYKSC